MSVHLQALTIHFVQCKVLREHDSPCVPGGSASATPLRQVQEAEQVNHTKMMNATGMDSKMGGGHPQGG